MRKLLAILVALTFVLALAACGTSKPPAPAQTEFKAQYKLATMTPAGHLYNQAGQKFADLVKERTNGRIQITLYPDGQLGKGERELLEAAQQGTIDLYVGSSGPLGGFSPSSLIVDIPFLFRDFAHVDKVLDGPVGRALLDDLEKANLKGLAYGENGFRNLTNSVKPVRTPDDAKGMKIRTMENKVHITAWKAAGVNPTPMAWGEVYGALQQRVIDGQENPVAVVATARIVEVQKYLSLTQHVYSPAPFIMSLKKWQALPKADQDIMLKAAQEAAVYQRKLGREGEEKMLKDIEAKGMTVTRDVDKTAWQKAMQPAFDEFSKQFGKEKIDAIVNTK